MKIDRDEVLRIGRLAHLEFDEAEVARISEQLSGILTYMESLGRLDTDAVEPTFQPIAGATPITPMRDDTVQPGLSADEATQGAPGGMPGQFVVPRVIG